jgi:uncharacterized protein (DUF2141 family)
MISCAQVRSVSGGEKDVTPPLVLIANPPFLSTNISPKKIVFTFDEYVQLNNIQQELVVSPPMSKAPTVKVKGKNVELTFQEELLPNKTYQINFGDGVADVNENNKAQDLIYVFSTGSTIDSLSCNGSVQLNETDTPGKSLKVLLFASDSAIFQRKSLPLYFAKSKDDGSFKLSYLAEGNYYLYALDDVNGNYRWDDGEGIAFQKSLIRISQTDTSSLLLEASVPRTSKPTVKEYLTDSIGHMKLVIDPFYHDLEITSLSGKKIKRFSEEDTIHVWVNEPITQGQEDLRIQWKEFIDDTITLRIEEEALKQRPRLFQKSNNKISTSDSFEISSIQLIQLTDKNLIQLRCDSILLSSEIQLNDSLNLLRISAKFSPGSKYEISLLPGAIRTPNGITNDTTKFEFTCYKKEELGLLNLTFLNMPDSVPCIFSLYNKSNELAFRRENCKNGSIEILGLPAGEYHAEILRDDNGNGLFDPADVMSKIFPERIYTYSGKISIRANWEVKAEWKFQEN